MLDMILLIIVTKKEISGISFLALKEKVITDIIFLYVNFENFYKINSL